MKIHTIRPNSLYISGRPDKPREEKLHELRILGVQVVVNLIKPTTKHPDVIDADLAKEMLYIHCPTVDGKNTDFSLIESYVTKVVRMMKAGAVVLVHCALGRNRSGLFCARLLMETEGLSGEQAIAEIRRCRPGALQTPAGVEYLRNMTKAL
jgi:protein-tyrosine phosphatase